jgi:hypothetical protein
MAQRQGIDEIHLPLPVSIPAVRRALGLDATLVVLAGFERERSIQPFDSGVLVGAPSLHGVTRVSAVAKWATPSTVGASATERTKNDESPMIVTTVTETSIHSIIDWSSQCIGAERLTKFEIDMGILLQTQRQRYACLLFRLPVKPSAARADIDSSNLQIHQQLKVVVQAHNKTQM